MDEKKTGYIIDGKVYSEEEREKMEGLKSADFNSLYPETMIAKNDVQIRHDGLPSGYITDKELFLWALVGVEGRIKELEEEMMTWSLKRLGNDKYVNLRKTLERVREKRVYLKEVLDGLG